VLPHTSSEGLPCSAAGTAASFFRVDKVATVLSSTDVSDFPLYDLDETVRELFKEYLLMKYQDTTFGMQSLIPIQTDEDAARFLSLAAGGAQPILYLERKPDSTRPTYSIGDPRCEKKKRLAPHANSAETELTSSLNIQIPKKGQQMMVGEELEKIIRGLPACFQMLQKQGSQQQRSLNDIKAKQDEILEQ